MVVVSSLRNNVRSVYDNRSLYTANWPTYSAVFTQQDSANADVCSSFCWTRVNTRMWPNVMVALPDIGGALCSAPQSLADAHYLTAVQ